MTGIVVVQTGDVGGHKLPIQGQGLIFYYPSQNLPFPSHTGVGVMLDFGETTGEPATKKS